MNYKINQLNNIKKLFKDNKAQISLEFLLILGVLIIGAVIVGIYLKQTAAKNANKVQQLEDSEFS